MYTLLGCSEKVNGGWRFWRKSNLDNKLGEKLLFFLNWIGADSFLGQKGSRERKISMQSEQLLWWYNRSFSFSLNSSSFVDGKRPGATEHDLDTRLWKAYTFPFQNFLTQSLPHTHIFHTSKKMTLRHRNEQALISIWTSSLHPYPTTYILTRLVTLVENGKICSNALSFEFIQKRPNFFSKDWMTWLWALHMCASKKDTTHRIKSCKYKK